MRSVKRTPNRCVLVEKSTSLRSLAVGFAVLLPNTADIIPARKPKKAFIFRRSVISGYLWIAIFVAAKSSSPVLFSIVDAGQSWCLSMISGLAL